MTEHLDGTPGVPGAAFAVSASDALAAARHLAAPEGHGGRPEWDMAMAERLAEEGFLARLRRAAAPESAQPVSPLAALWTERLLGAAPRYLREDGQWLASTAGAMLPASRLTGSFSDSWRIRRARDAAWNAARDALACALPLLPPEAWRGPPGLAEGLGPEPAVEPLDGNAPCDRLSGRRLLGMIERLGRDAAAARIDERSEPLRPGPEAARRLGLMADCVSLSAFVELEVRYVWAGPVPGATRQRVFREALGGAVRALGGEGIGDALVRSAIGLATVRFHGGPAESGRHLAHAHRVEALVNVHGGTPEQRCAALLHRFRDAEPPPDPEIADGLAGLSLSGHFGPQVAALVEGLSERSRPGDGDRAARRAIDHAHWADQPPMAKAVRCADVACRLTALRDGDADAARRGIDEARALVPRLSDAVPKSLWTAAEEALAAAEALFPEGPAAGLRSSPPAP